MNKIYWQRERIRAGQMDTVQRLRLDSALELFQDITSVHSEEMGVSNRQMAAESGAYWVITRTKVRFYEPLRFFDEIMAETWPNQPSSLVCGRNYRIFKGERLAAEGRSEWMLLDRQSHSPRDVASTCYPLSEEHEQEKVLPEPFLRMKEIFGPEDLAYEIRVRASDIDMSHHVNNVKYVRFMLDSFPVEELEKMEVREFEIRYGRESREGDVLQVWRRPTEDGWSLRVTREDGTETAAGRIRLKQPSA